MWIKSVYSATIAPIASLSHINKHDWSSATARIRILEMARTSFISVTVVNCERLLDKIQIEKISSAQSMHQSQENEGENFPDLSVKNEMLSVVSKDKVDAFLETVTKTWKKD